MSRARIVQTQFTGGQISTKLRGRVDLDKYHKSVATAINVIPIPQGGMAKRSGTEYVASLPEGKKTFLKFEFNTEQTYLMVLTAGKIYIFRDGVLQTNINGLGNDYLIVDYTEAQLDYIDYVQSADTMLIVHPDVPVKSITRTGHSTWIYADFGVTSASYDFGEVNYNSFTFSCTAGGDFGTRQLTSDQDIFTSAHVGGAFRTSQGFARITAFTDAKTVVLNVLEDLDRTADTSEFAMFSGAVVRVQEPAFNASKGYPRTVTFHEGRLWFGGSRELPQTMWGSVSGDFHNFEVGESLDDESIELTLDTDEVNAIQHIVSGRHLCVFTTGGEFYIRTTSGGPIIPSDLSATRVDEYGASKVIKPVRIATQILFVDYDRKHLRSFVFDLTKDNYSTGLTTLLAPDIINEPVDIERFNNFGDEEGNYVIVVNTDGTIALLNLMPSENIQAWTKISMQPGVKVTHVREVEGVIYLGLTGVKAGEDTLVQFKADTYMDANQVFTGTTSAVITGLTHLEGKTVRVVADGNQLTDRVVSGGNITIEVAAADRVEVGLGYEVNILTLPVSPQDELGIENIEVKRVNFVECMVSEETLGVILDGERTPDRTFGNNVLGASANNEAGYRRAIRLGWGRIIEVRITQTDSLPFVLQTLGCQIEI